MEYKSVTGQNINEVIEYSVQLSDQIDALTKERQKLSEILMAFLLSTGIDTYVTPNNRQLKLFPALSRSLSDLNKYEKQSLTNWAIEKFPELLLINHARLQNILAEGAVAPIPMDSKGFALRIIKEKKDTRVKKIEELFIKGTEKKESSIIDTWSELPKRETPQNTKTIHQQRTERLADLQVMWDEGKTFRSMGQKYGIESSHVKRLLKPYINGKLRELRHAIMKSKEQFDSTVSVNIED